MTFEEWFVSSGWFGFGSAVEIAANDGYEAGYKQAIIDCYGEAAASLVLESLRKASNRPVEPFSSGGEGKGSQTQVAQPQPAPEHVCGLQGFGALGDVCPACAQRRAEWDAEKAAPQAAQPLTSRSVDDAVYRALQMVDYYGEACGHGDASDCGAAREAVERSVDALVAVATAPPGAQPLKPDRYVCATTCMPAKDGKRCKCYPA